LHALCIIYCGTCKDTVNKILPIIEESEPGLKYRLEAYVMTIDIKMNDSVYTKLAHS